MIQLKQITKNYGTSSALKGIDLEVNQGEFVTLIGPSGCGKSTLIRIVNRMIEPSSGELWIDGQNALDIDPVLLRRSIGYVIQSAGLFPHLTVQENVEIVPQLLGWSKAKRRLRAEELLDIVGLAPDRFAQRYPKALSGGQQQRVGIARALAADPAILLMDEPFSAVDPITREQLQDELLRIQSTVRKTILFVTHDIHEAIRLGDKVALLNDGQVEQYSDPDALLTQPANDFVAHFLGQERELQRLSRHVVADFVNSERIDLLMETNPDDVLILSPENSISKQSSARSALSRLLGGAASLHVVNEQGQPIGKISLQDFAR